jgi:large exoprotein involved in heme utilization and adhesion
LTRWGTVVARRNSRKGSVFLRGEEHTVIACPSVVLVVGLNRSFTLRNIPRPFYPKLLSVGQGGNITLIATNLEVLNGAQLNAATFGIGNAGNVHLIVRDTARFDGFNSSNIDTEFGIDLVEREVTVGENNLSLITASVRGFRGLDNSGSSALSSIEEGGEGNGGNVLILANSLEATNGAILGTLNAGIGDAGNIAIDAEVTLLDGFNVQSGGPSGVTSIIQGGTGNSGNIDIRTSNLSVSNGAQLSTSPFGNGNAGDIRIVVDETASFSGSNAFNETVSGVFSNLPSSEPEGENISLGGNIILAANRLEILDNASLSTSSFGSGNSGNILVIIEDQLWVGNGTIETASLLASGGSIAIFANNVFLEGDSDIQTFVASGEGGGGNITIAADFVIALDDSDILAFSRRWPWAVTLT